VIACHSQVMETVRPLISGYHRDFQETKRPLMTGLEITQGALQVCGLGISKLAVDEERCVAAFTSEVFATDRALDMVKAGIPFRDAYKQVALSLEKTAMEDPRENIRKKVHLGATGNLGLDLARSRLTGELDWMHKARAAWAPAIAKLLK